MQNLFNPEAYQAAALAEMGISEEKLLLMGIRERNELLDAIDAQREADIRDWEDQLGPDA